MPAHREGRALSLNVLSRQKGSEHVFELKKSQK